MRRTCTNIHPLPRALLCTLQVMLSAQPCGDNWLPLAADATRVVVRQTFLDRGTEAAAQLHLERLAPQGLVRPTLQATQVRKACNVQGVASTLLPLPCAARTACLCGCCSRCSGASLHASPTAPLRSLVQVVSGLAGAALLAAGSAMQFNRWVALFADEYHNTLRSLEFDQYMTAWADPSITFFHGYWAVGEVRCAAGAAAMDQRSSGIALCMALACAIRLSLAAVCQPCPS